jgi:uncharacterized protein
MKVFFYLCLVGISQFSFAQEWMITFYDYPEGQIREKFQYRVEGNDTLKHGEYFIYHSNGQLWQHGIFLNNELSGIWKDFYTDGTLKQILPYEEGKLNGTIKYYYADGSLYQKAEYTNDLQNGQTILYFPDSLVSEVSDYKEGKLHGMVTSYFKDGKIRAIEKYYQGIPHGSQKKYYENGKISEYYYMDNGQYSGRFLGFYKEYADSTLNKECHYLNGKLHGPYFGYYPSGSLMVKCIYEDDAVTGEFKKYYDSGSPYDTLLMEIGLYSKGMRDGLWYSYYQNGSLNSKGNI